MENVIERVPTSLGVEEFETLPPYGDYKLELSAATLIREPPPGAEHGWINTALAHRLQAHVESSGAGVALTNAGFVLSHDPPIVRSPDVAWVAAHHGRPDARAWRGAPDLAVEIVSPSDRYSDVQEKVGQYLAAGVRLVWVVDPATRQVTAHGSPDEIRLVRNDGVLEGGEVLPGFRLAVAELFGS
jgi:Uma2 family endonuclease